jgi:hypothetical protein
MIPALDLTPDEREQLESRLAASGQQSLNELVRQWTDFVHAVERGYDDSIYEYTNDLSVRDILQRLLTAASPALRAKLERALAPVDERFTAATEESAQPLGTADGSWWRRVPKRRVGELADDLSAEDRPGLGVDPQERGAQVGEPRRR